MSDVDLRLTFARHIIRARRLELRIAAAYRRGAIPASAFLGSGQEAFSAAAGVHLRSGDRFAPLIRDMAGRLAFGETMLEALRVYYGKRTSKMRGRDGNVHRGDVEQGMLPMISHLGAMGSVVAGTLFAFRHLGSDRHADGRLLVGVASLGEGAFGTGANHEAMNLVGIERLPMIFLVANNQYSYSTTNERSFPCDRMLDRAAGYGMRAHACDGCDPFACLETVGAAIAAARDGDGPQMVEATLLRRSGHGEHDDATYVLPELFERFPDCYEVLRERLVADGLLADVDLDAWDAEIDAEIDAAMTTTEADPDPDPEREDWCAYSERWLTEGLRP